MESFIFVEKKEHNGRKYYLISNYSHSLVLDESSLKAKMSSEVSVSNLKIENNKLVEKSNTTTFHNERELFYFELSDIITVNCNSIEPMLLVINKLKEINRRTIQFDNDKQTIKGCLHILEKYFEYMGKIDFKFLGEKYIDTLENKNLKDVCYSIAGEGKIDKVLSKYIQDGTIKIWKDDRSTNAYCYKQLVSCLKKLYDLNYSEDRKEKISSALQALGFYFTKVKPNPVGWYLYGYFMLRLSEACLNALKNHRPLSIKSVKEMPDGRILSTDLEGRNTFLKSSAGRHEEQYKFNRKQILKNGERFNNLVNRYNDDTKQLLDCIIRVSPMTPNDTTNLENILKKYTFETEEKYKEIMNNFITICNKNNNTDLVKIVEGLSEFSNLTNFNPINCGISATKMGIGVCGLLAHKLETCLNDTLSSESQKLLLQYNDISIGQKGILLYVLDKVRLQTLKKVSPQKRKQLKLYSNMGIVPLIDSMFFTTSAWEARYRSSFYKKDLKGIEVSWLTTYYIMNEKVDGNKVYIRRNNALVSWKYFLNCLKIYIPDIQKEELYNFKGLLVEEYHWDLSEDKEINLYSLLKI